jgi:GTP-binding protein HflX
MVELEVVSAKGQGASGRGAMSGEGEMQLEIERRRVTDYEAKLRTQLDQILVRSERRAKDPKLKHCPSVAIIGYTNAGKTALMNYLVGENLLSQNMLFQTLNTTVRKLGLPSGQSVHLLDTVGFISDLPHDLVEAFKATLEGVQYADVIMHIRDISHPCSELQKATVFRVLQDLGSASNGDFFSRYLEVWNKVDLIEAPLDLEAITKAPYKIVPISAVYGINCGKLLEVLDSVVCRVTGRQMLKLQFPLKEFSARLKWIREQLDITQPKLTMDETYAYVEIPMDEHGKRRYLAAFPEASASGREAARRGM